MSFKEIDLEKNLQYSYTSANMDIVDEFYNRILSESKFYDRISGFFNSTSLAVAAYGMTNFVKNNGHMRLICGAELSSEDLNSINNANDLKNIININFSEDLDNLEDEFQKNYVKLLGWMVANNYLEIKIGILKNNYGEYQSGMIHSKKGILYDEEGESISFGGSVNETAFGWKVNIESLDVFYSWKSPPEYLSSHKEEFDDLWEGKIDSVEIFDVPDATKKKLIKIAPKNISELNLTKKSASNVQKPILRDYQSTALNSWINNKYKGIFSMATGTGKTITALSCYDHLNSNKTSLLTVIVCPQKHLITQWEENLRKFDNETEVILAYGDNTKWKRELLSMIGDLNSNINSKVIILTIFNSFSSNDFLSIINYYEGESLVIIDEVHGIGSTEFRKGLIDIYTYRLGLSATPEIEDDFERTDLVYDYFGNVVYEYNLKTAIDNGFLTPYNYFPEFIDLNEKELEQYKYLTFKIASLYAKKNKTSKDEIQLNNALINRSNIINNAEQKIIFIKKFLYEHKNIKNMIIYGTRKQLNLIEDILNDLNISYHEFTGEEKSKKGKDGLSQRDKILKLFAKGHFNILLAIKCLDEGVDVPSTQTAILMSSTLNSRQHIQRRGRILRKSPGKKIANIIDLIVLPDIKDESNSVSTIIKNEQKRYLEYAKLAENFTECSKKLTDKIGGI